MKMTELYYNYTILIKKKKKEAMLPMNDFRGLMVKKTSKNGSTFRLVSLKKVLSEIAALW
jgi:hypothetical protein